MSLIGIGGFNGDSGKAYFGNIYSSTMEHPELQITGGSSTNINVKMVERGTYSYGGKTGEGTVFSITTRSQPRFNLTNPFPQEQITYAFLADCINNNECPTGYKCCYTSNYTNYGTIKGDACIKENPSVYLDKMALVLNTPSQGLYDLEKLWAMQATQAKNAKDNCKYQIAITNLKTIQDAMALREGLTPKINISEVEGKQPTTVPSLQPGQQPVLPPTTQPYTQSPATPAPSTGTTTTTPSAGKEIVVTQTIPPSNTNAIIFGVVVAGVVVALIGYSIYTWRK